MNQIQLLITFLMLSINGFSQNKFSIGINGNAQITKMTINESMSPTGIDEKGEIGFGYSAGLQIEYNIKERVFLRSGIGYQELNHRHLIEGLRFGTDIQNGTSSSIQNDILISSIIIPLDIGCRIPSKKGKLNYLIGVGGMVNINLDTKSTAIALHQTIENQPLEEVNNQVEPSIYSIGLFGGIEINLSKKVIVGLEPNLRFTLNNFTLFLFESESTTTFESGLTLRIRMK